MTIPFHKYQGTGNDFVIIDNRKNLVNKISCETIKKICDRRFGVGADGLMFLENHIDYDFKMVYFNADGNESSMCGNGGRCMVAFANSIGVSSSNGRFMAIDGEHEFEIANGDHGQEVSLKMIDVSEIEIASDYYLNTGSPHYVVFKNNVEKIDLVTEGRKIRYNQRFEALGTNVNFAEFKGDKLFVRTYERGVEDETLSCGTGVTAVALAAATQKNDVSGSLQIITKGGALEVFYEKAGKSSFVNVWLKGPAEFVFKGEMVI